MKVRAYVFLTTLLLSGSFNLVAQTLVNGGNSLAGDGSLGTTTNFSFLFKTNNIERARVTNGGLWGFGTTTPVSKVQINSVTGQMPLLVQINGTTKFFIQNNGGASIGANLTPPANGLSVAGNAGIGTSTPESKLHVFKGSAGTVTGDANSPLIVENSTHSFISILAPDAFATGVIFGKPASNVSGGIFYNAPLTLNGFEFRTNGNIARMALKDNGNLGIGADPGDYKLKISFSQSKGLSIENTQNPSAWEMYPNTNLILIHNGVFKGAFSTTDGTYKSVSDERFKTNIRPMGTVLEKIKLLKPATYQFRNSADTQQYNGFIAQEVKNVFPAMVTHTLIPERNFDVYTMDYTQFGVLAIKAILELQPIIDSQKIENEKQKSINKEQEIKIIRLEERLAKLEAVIANKGTNQEANLPASNVNISLAQNQPNPFNENTTMRYHIPQGSKGQINVYDQTGAMVKTFRANESGESVFNANDLAPGIYIYTLMISSRATVSRKLLIKR